MGTELKVNNKNNSSKIDHSKLKINKYTFIDAGPYKVLLNPLTNPEKTHESWKVNFFKSS